MKRLYFFFGLLSLTSACSHQQAVTQRFEVSVIRVAGFQVELCDRIRRALIDHEVPVRDQQIVLRPHLVEFSQRLPINTSSIFVTAAVGAFRFLGVASVRIAEGPEHQRVTVDMAEAAGCFEPRRRCVDHGWSHGGFKTRSEDANSYSETTDLALLALCVARLSAPSESVSLPERFLLSPEFIEGPSWIQMALPPQIPNRDPSMLPQLFHNRDAALRLQALSARRGGNVFLEKLI